MESVNTRQTFKFLHNHRWPNNQITPGPDGSNTNHWFDLTTFIGCMDTHTHHHIIFAGAAWLYFLSCDAKPAALRVHSALTTHRPGRQTQLWETPQQPVAVISAWRSAVGSAGSEDAKGGFVCRCVAFMDHSVDTDLQHGVTVCPASSPGHQDGATWFSSLTVSSDVLLHLPLVSISI